MSGLRSLFKDTAIYGLSSILGRMINWLLVPYYTYTLTQVQDYGIVTNIYAWVALLLILLTYGTETGYFRFANNKQLQEPTVYSTLLTTLAITSSLFIILTSVFAQPLATALNYPEHQQYIIIMSFVLGIDAFSSIPFARLRYQQRPIRFASLKLLNITLSIGLNLFFLSFCPWWLQQDPDGLASLIYNPDKQVYYIFLANLIASLTMLFILSPNFINIKWHFDRVLLRQILHYSLPLLIVGLAGSLSLFVDKVLYPYIAPAGSDILSDLGIYGANYKIAVIMVMLTQAFRFAFEPFIFAQNKKEAKLENSSLYVQTMNWFIAFGLLVFLGVCFFLDIIKYMVEANYHSGLGIVPIILVVNLLLGILFNLSLWYKLSDKTQYGAYIALVGAAITLTLNLIFTPVYGYWACAWASFACYATMVVVSYFWGQKYYPIPYHLKKIALYVAVAATLYIIHAQFICPIDNPVVQYALRIVLLSIFALVVIRKENLSSLIFNRKP